MSNDVRRLLIDICEDLRECSHCKKSLSYVEDTIIITIPRSKLVYEYCGWFCLFSNVKTLLYKKLISSKLSKDNLLTKLNYDGKEHNIIARLKEEQHE
jgi:hypothetical protein